MFSAFASQQTMTKTASSPKSFEAAISELERIVQEMEAGTITLEESLERYQRGVGLLKYCQNTLQSAEQKLLQLEGDTLTPRDAEGGAA
jgi:exodeoxyribonuclease VII small subunit